MSKKRLHVKRLDEQNVVREQLLKYCELDTLVIVLVKLKEVYNAS